MNTTGLDMEAIINSVHSIIAAWDKKNFLELVNSFDNNQLEYMKSYLWDVWCIEGTTPEATVENFIIYDLMDCIKEGIEEGTDKKLEVWKALNRK